MIVLEAWELPGVCLTCRLIELKAAARRSGGDGQGALSLQPAGQFSLFTLRFLSLLPLSIILSQLSLNLQMCVLKGFPRVSTWLRRLTVSILVHFYRCCMELGVRVVKFFHTKLAKPFLTRFFGHIVTPPRHLIQTHKVLLLTDSNVNPSDAPSNCSVLCSPVRLTASNSTKVRLISAGLIPTMGLSWGSPTPQMSTIFSQTLPSRLCS